MDFGLPEMLLKINDLIFFYGYTFAFEQLLHKIRAFEMMLSRKHSDAVDDTVSRNVIRAIVHRPTDHPRGTGGPDRFCDGTVGRDFPERDLPGDLVYAFKEIGFHF